MSRRIRAFPLAPLLELRGTDRTLLWGFAALFVVEGVLIVAYGLFPVPSVWTLGAEGSLPTFLHSAILATIALVCWSISAMGMRGRVHVPKKHALVWVAGGLSFVYLSMDEALELHERLSRHVFEYVGIQDRIAHYELSPALWEVVFAPVFAAIGLVILWVLFRERHRVPVAFRTGLAAMGLWSLALVTEFIEMTYFVHMGFWFGAAIWLEETSEMLASTLFLVAVTLIIRRVLGWGRKQVVTGPLM